MAEAYGKYDRERHEQFRADVAYFNAHGKEIRRTYPNCHVAVYKGEVVGADTDQKKLLKALKEKGIPTNAVVRRYIADPPRKLVL